MATRIGLNNGKSEIYICICISNSKVRSEICPGSFTTNRAIKD